jgi:hypothetical protein
MDKFNPRRGKKAEKSKRTAILLEHEGQVKDFLKRSNRIKGQKLILALSPFAIYELDKQDLPYKTPEDYYDSKELYKLGINNYKKVEDLCDIIDEHIQNAFPTIAKLGIRPALFSFYHLKIIYDVVTIRLFQLSKLIEDENPNVLYVYDGKRFPFGISRMAPYLYFDNRESIYARLLTCKGWETSVTTLPYVPPPENSDKPQSSSKALKAQRWLQRHHRLHALIAETRKRGLHGLFDGLKSCLGAGGEIRVLIFGRGYDWDDCGAELESAGIDHFTRIWDDLEYWMNHRSSDTSADALNDAWRGLRVDDKFRKFFVRDNIDFFPVLEERLQFLVEQLTPACINAYKETAELLKKRKIKAFLSSAFDSCTSHSAARAARNSNVPVVTWQEGSYGYFDHPIAIYNNLMDSDAFFTYGEGVVSEYLTSAKRFNTRLLPIGSASLDALSQAQQSKKVKKLASTMSKRVVLYETTNYYQNSLYLSIPPPFSDNHFWHTQRTILDTLAKHHDYTAIVKLHPNPMYRVPPMRAYAETQKFKNCRFFRDEYTATDLLSIADLLVIDFPTTTLLEALTTSKPIFVYTGHLHINAQAQKLLERRAFCYQELKSLTDALNEYLSEGKIDRKVNLNDKKFLEAYGVGPQKGGSAVRAAKMLKQIIPRA